MFRRLREDIKMIFERDPAAKGVLEVLVAYPGLHALWFHRVANALYRWRLFTLARYISHVSRFLTGIEIHPGARIGRRFFIDHGLGVVIGETTRIGDDVTIYQGVTLGGTGKERGKRHPTIEDGVIVGVGAKVLGSITVGAGSRVGAGAVVVKDVPPNCTVVGIPGRIVVRDGRRVGARVPDLEHGNLPDPVHGALAAMQKEIERLSERLAVMAEHQASRSEHRGAAAREEVHEEALADSGGRKRD